MLSVTFLSQGADVKVCLGFQIEMLPAPLGAQHFADTWIYEKTPMKEAKLTCFAKPKNSTGTTLHPRSLARPSALSARPRAALIFWDTPSTHSEGCALLLSVYNALYNVPAGPRAKEAVKSASSSTSRTGTAGCTGDLRASSHAKEGYGVITSTS